MNEIRRLISIKGLKTEFKLKTGNILKAVDGIDLDIKPGEIHGLVGESGCGKTGASLSILGLINRPGRITGGKILWAGRVIGYERCNALPRPSDKIPGRNTPRLRIKKYTAHPAVSRRRLFDFLKF